MEIKNQSRNLKTYRVYRIGQRGKSEAEFGDVPATSQKHAKLVAMSNYGWPRPEIKAADEFWGDWTGLLWYVVDSHGHVIKNENGEPLEFALEREARKYISGLPKKDYDTERRSAFDVRGPRKRIES